jgi:hypothetical protein
VATGDIHLKFYSFSIRERLRDQNGHANNQVILGGVSGRPNADDRWLSAIRADSSNLPKWRKVVANKPADVVDACWDLSGNKIAETQAFGTGQCNTIYPPSLTPNLVAGAPIQDRILKCQLKTPDAADYAVSFSAGQWSRLNAIFPEGVCDWSKPGVDETEVKTWASFGPSPQNQLFDVTQD